MCEASAFAVDRQTVNLARSSDRRIRCISTSRCGSVLNCGSSLRTMLTSYVSHVARIYSKQALLRTKRPNVETPLRTNGYVLATLAKPSLPPSSVRYPASPLDSRAASRAFSDEQLAIEGINSGTEEYADTPEWRSHHAIIARSQTARTASLDDRPGFIGVECAYGFGMELPIHVHRPGESGSRGRVRRPDRLQPPRRRRAHDGHVAARDLEGHRGDRHRVLRDRELCGSLEPARTISRP